VDDIRTESAGASSTGKAGGFDTGMNQVIGALKFLGDDR
jgi:hypothetical protein